MTPIPEVMQHAVAGLTPSERQEMSDIITYLTEHASVNRNPMPEGSAAHLLNKATPAVRQRFKELSTFIETPRVRPFDLKMTESDNAEAVGLYAPTTTLIKAALDTSEVSGRLGENMGTDADRTPDEPTRRDEIAAAFEVHSHE